MFSLSITYPIAFPTLIAYAVSKDLRYLDFLYSIRSATHGVPRGNGLRVSKQDGIELLFPSREDPNFEDVFLRNVYFPYKPQKTDVVFDIGAHMGFFTAKIAKHVDKVVAFEPDPKNFAFLLENLRRNKLINVVALNFALGKEDASLFLERHYGQGRTKVTDQDTGYRINVRSVNSIAQSLGLKPNVIKIDTEGYELPILQGAKSIIDNNKPKFLIAAYHYPGEVSDVAKYLSANHYLCYRYDVPHTLQKTKESYIYAEPLKNELFKS
jgi:FkbM family methyltransferase